MFCTLPQNQLFSCCLLLLKFERRMFTITMSIIRALQNTNQFTRYLHVGTLNRSVYTYTSRCQRNLSVNEHFSTETSTVSETIPFSKAQSGPFVQCAPYLENSFEGDVFLQRNLKRILPEEVILTN